jgi:nifR3 family TIM-barrel protein
MHIGTLQLKNNIFLAPMAGITDLPFRIIARAHGCALAFTEMVNATGLARRMKKTERYLDSCPEDTPLGVQLFGTAPDILAEAAAIVTDMGADLIDINMGCPVKKVVKTGAGAALMRNPMHVGMILNAVRKATPLPLTVKIRSGWRPKEVNAPEIAHIAEENGTDAVVIHPRTADQGFSGSADWDIIKKVKDSVTIPVIGSGDVKVPRDAERMLELTSCDAVMIGRGALGNPWIFKGIIGADTAAIPFVPDLEERKRVIARHLDLTLAYHGGDFGVIGFRKHLLWYTKGLKGGAGFRQSAGSIRNRDQLMHELEVFFAELSHRTDLQK